MAHPDMSHKPRLSPDTVDHGSNLPSHYVVAPLESHASSIRSGLVKGLIVGLAVFAGAFFGLHMFFDMHPVYLNVLHTHRDSSVMPCDANHAAKIHMVSDEFHTFNQTLPTKNSDLARRQTGGDKQWFFIPVSSSRYRFSSHGEIHGTFRVVPFRSLREDMVVKVQIADDPSRSARVSASSSSDGETDGIEISSNGFNSYKRPTVDVTVYLPVPDRPLRLNNFETQLSGYTVIFPDLSRYVTFSRLWISATPDTTPFGSWSETKNLNSGINMGSVVADKVFISNGNAPITGNMAAVLELGVSNRNAKIDGEYTILSAGGIVKLTNANSDISARLRLRQRSSIGRSGFHVETSNKEGSIDLKFLEQPLRSGLFLKAFGVLTDMRVHLHAAYEGRFDVRNPLTPSKILVNNTHDPTGRGRERVKNLDRDSPGRRGMVTWGSVEAIDEYPLGTVDLRNTGRSTELIFD